ncbi:MAG: hypothetical protein WBE98_09065 [Gammaproteobacteria bacterium]
MRRDEERIGKEHRQMNIAYDVEFDLDSFLQSMDDPERPAWRRIEDHMERRRLREELSAYDDLDGYLDD